MPTYVCICGARYRFADASMGKRAKCKKCETVFMLEDSETGEIAISPEIGLAGEVDAAVSRSTTSPTAMAAAVSGGPSQPPFGPPKVIIEAPERDRTYMGDLVDSFFFPRHLGNLITFVFLWLMLCLAAIVLPFAAIIGMVGAFIIQGWYCAFRFGVIAESGSGKEDLPELTLEGGVWDGIFAPLLSWLGSWIIVLVPAIIVQVTESGGGFSTIIDVLRLLTGGIADLIQNAIETESWALLATFCAGLFIWPLIVLCLALGGTTGVGRIDLLFETIFKTLPVYLLTVVLAYLPVVIELVAADVKPGFLIAALLVGAALYLEIVGLRAIGLYYHHFKDKFAWSWG